MVINVFFTNMHCCPMGRVICTDLMPYLWHGTLWKYRFQCKRSNYIYIYFLHKHKLYVRKSITSWLLYSKNGCPPNSSRNKYTVWRFHQSAVLKTYESRTKQKQHWPSGTTGPACVSPSAAILSPPTSSPSLTITVSSWVSSTAPGSSKSLPTFISFK